MGDSTKRTWTAQQTAAIRERNKTLLVSAAAGSGKTATLTERVIRSLTDPEHPGDISRMLIVTFTRAAAAELRTRIAAALTEEMHRTRHTAHLSRQMLLLSGAPICTIDSFCLDIVRKNAARIGLSPAFRPSDPAENELLLHDCMERLLEDCYAGTVRPDLPPDADPSAPSFEDLFDLLLGRRQSDRLPEFLLRLYSGMTGHVDFPDTILHAAERMRAQIGLPFEKTPWGDFLLRRACGNWRMQLARYEELLSGLAENEIARNAYLPAFEEDAAMLRRLIALSDGGRYAELRDALRDAVTGKQKLKAIKTENQSELTERAKKLREDLYKKEITPPAGRCFGYSEEEWQAFLPREAAYISLLGQLMRHFHRRVMEEKKKRNLYSFDDVTRAALSLLCEEDGSPTPLAREIAADYDYVYVDEYQDVNEVQHRIFAALSTERNRFMVGDVKQSIYAFRGAQPAIFASARQAYPSLSDDDAPAASLSLSENFRSEKNVLDFVNLVYGGMMDAIGAGIGYVPATDDLVPGRAPSPDAPPVCVRLFSGHVAGEAPEGDDEDAPDDERADEMAAPDDGQPIGAEEAFVAQEIRRLVREGKRTDGAPLRPGDIAILTRTGSGGGRFARALAALGIRTESGARPGFFMNPEVMLAVSLLNVIDNPRRDVHLSGVLRSPLYGFTLDDLVRIRMENGRIAPREGSLYEALCAYMEKDPTFEKGARFLSALSDFRRAAEGQPVDRLIAHIYRESGLLTLSGEDGSDTTPAARRENLMMLYDYARRFESSSFHGLYSFIAYLNEVLAKDQTIEESHALSDRSDAVRLLTIHQSKGLEYPVVFVCDAGHGFNRRDAQDTLLFCDTLGPAVMLRDESGFARLRNPLYEAVSAQIRDSALEEATRVLYVALTRPRERLYVTGTVPDPAATLERAEQHGRFFSAAAVYDCHHYMDMILATAEKAGGTDRFDFQVILGNDTPESRPVCRETDGSAGKAPSTPADEQGKKTAASPELTACLFHRFGYGYPDRYLTELPSKLSVSALYPTVLDGTETEYEMLRTGPDETADEEPNTPDMEAPVCRETQKQRTLPRFLGGARNTAAQAGTATHLFMQFCDFGRLRDNGAAAELSRLVEQHFIDPADGELVRLPEVEAFRRSDFFRLLLQPDVRLFRELRFHVRMPAAAFTEDAARRGALADASLLVQGVMDGVALLPDGTLLLFDYKTDRLTAAEKRDPAAAARKLIARHGAQLGYYAAACRDIFGRVPDRVALYALALGDAVEFTPVLPY